jgi:uncharacterized protein (DUF2384 family)
MELKTREQLPAHSQELLKDIEDIFAAPEAWLEMPNTRLAGQKPIDLIGTPEEERVRNITESIKHGLYS